METATYSRKEKEIVAQMDVRQQENKLLSPVTTQVDDRNLLLH